jgi:hypothetical protein
MVTNHLTGSSTTMADSRTLLAVVALALLAAPASAADFPVKVTAARVGLPPNVKPGEDSGQSAFIAKFACWVPLYVDLELTGPISDPVELLIESPDPDEITTTLAIPLNLAGAGGKVSAAERGAIGYVRLAGSGEVTITVRKQGGEVLSEPFRLRSLRPRDPLTYVVLSLGNSLAGFDLSKAVTAGGEPLAGLRGGRVEVAAITDFAHLPDRWLGYDGADIVVLNTGADDFLRKLFGEGGDKTKREAMLEWVRRGGRLVVAVGANAKLIAGELRELRELLPLDVSGSRTLGSLALYWSGRESSTASTLSGVLTGKAPFPVATLVPKEARPSRVLIPPSDRRASIKDISSGQAAYGLGRVTVVGFDLDRPPFTEFALQPEFWDWVLREGGANRASLGSDGKPKPGATGPTDEEDEVAAALRTHTDTFDGVPVVSFGWVALLIILYILLIGPIEYFFLKRILGRLELTWITFPIIVLTVSLAAYFSTYSIKGHELKVNKLDVVDVDAASGRVYGTTWFTLFSPRIETYTLGISPGDGWGAAEPGTSVSWLGAPRGGRASLLHRKYAYRSDAAGLADGLEQVPVQMWSTKSFVANWSGHLDSAVGMESRLEHPPGDPTTVIGTFVNHLPVPVLFDCVAFYAGQAYPLPGGTIHSGDTIRLVFDKGVPSHQWLQKESRLRELLDGAGIAAERTGPAKGAAPQQATVSSAVAAPVGSSLPMLGVLFHESSLTYAEGVIPRNASLRRLDQSWRLTPENRSEVILVGRATPPVGPAESALSGPNAASRLWLKGLPGSGDRPPIPGTGRQETWVRVYLPVR